MVKKLRALLAAALGLVVILPASVGAAENPAITVTDMVLEKVDVNGVPQEGGLVVGDYVDLSFKWDATQADVTAGDSFTIDLGTSFQNLKFPITTPMTVTYNGADVQIGSCDLTKTQITCTFSDKVDELKAAGFSAFKGSGKAALRVIAATNSTTADITANGTVGVDLPGDGGIAGPVGESYNPWKLSKWGVQITSDTDLQLWGIQFGTKQIADNSTMTFDGVTERTLTFIEEIGDGQVFREDDLTLWNLKIHNSAENPNQSSNITLTYANSGVQNGFKMDVRLESDKKAIITVTGPFAPEANYLLHVYSRFTSADGYASQGVRYSNRVTLKDLNVSDDSWRMYVDSFSITVEMEAGFGGFDITKILSGNALDEVPAGTTFKVKVAYVLPDVASAYTGWDAPGTLNADQKTGTAEMTITVGKKEPFRGTFPKGTKITLSEDVSSSSAQSPDYTWEEPKFTIGGKEGSSFVIADQVSTAVQLENTVTKVLKGTFQVRKAVEGADAAEKSFVFNYTCSDGQSGTLTAPGNGTVVTADKTFPLGTTCEITEDTSNADLEGYTLTAPAAKTVTIAATTVVEASFTNVYDRDMGMFQVKKVVTGDYTAQPGETFLVNYTCDDPAQTAGELEVSANGEAVSSVAVPTGTKCTITEESASAERQPYSVDISYSSPDVTVVKGSSPEVTVTNNYTQLRGTFQVRKAVSGADAATAKSFVFDYTCSDGQNGSLTARGDGTVVTADKTFPVGTTCEIAEDVDSAALEGYTLTPPDPQTVTIESDPQVVEASFTNAYERDMGTFSVKKAVTGATAAVYPTDEFKVTYSCDNPENTVGVLGLPASGEAVAGPSVPAGTTCTITEDHDSAQREGYAVAISYSDPSVTVVKNGNPEVTVTNDYLRLTGGFAISKTVEGDGASLAPASFDFEYQCVDMDDKPTVNGTIEGVAAGESKSVEDIPTGKCTITEKDAKVPNAKLGTTWKVDGVDVDENSVIVEVTDGSAVAVAATNTYTLDRGTFSLAKKVTGDGVDKMSARDYLFTYTCTSDVEGELTGTLKVPGDGTAVASELKLPIGTKCTVAEDAESAKAQGYTLKAPADQTITIESAEQAVELSFTNDYKEVPPPPTTPPTPKKPGKPSLPKTGASVGGLLLIAGGLAATGGALVARRRRA